MVYLGIYHMKSNYTKLFSNIFCHYQYVWPWYFITSYLGGGFGAGCFFPPAGYTFLLCIPSVDTTVEDGAVIRLEDWGIGPVIFPEILLAGRTTDGLILLTWTFFSPLRNLGNLFTGTFVNGQLMPSIFGNWKTQIHFEVCNI